MADTPPDTSGSARPDASLGELLADVSKDLSTLMRQEVELAKAEMQQSASRAGRGAGMFSGAALGGWMALLFLSVALWWGLGDLAGHAWAAVIVAAIWAVIAGVLAALGRTEMRKIKGTPKTAETVKQIPDALKGQEERR
ncbi:phage holin family protein [Phytoactinopolyspora alkaliphila]|uniref:Phage holin family protein n=1 Tax=Phytoactinopolyspora alkaliphila TaxID=1783498 RepID=A0A6N9YNR0_9ACTN|nr:phage holin family protein [Phytoactinopolyspora alkaliphila]NED96570.1 phage holin family protein [Phytoactinopolyspora alkaliphila]